MTLESALLEADSVRNPLREIYGIPTKSKDVIRFSVEEIATGGTALIYRRRYSNSWEEIEKILLPKFQSRRDYEDLQQNEWRILSGIQHPLIVKACRLENRRSCTGQQTNVLVLEPVGGIPLSYLPSFLDSLADDLREAFSNKILKQLAAVGRYLQSRALIHGDLCPDNILLQPSGLIKVIDFGTARKESEASHSFQVLGKPAYRAPEIRFSGRTSLKADIFSIGRIFEEILGTKLAAKDNNRKIIELMQNQRVLPSFDCSVWFEEISPLPDFENLKIVPVGRRKTKIEGRGVMSFARALAFPCLLVSMFFYLSSFLPQWADVSFNTIPPSSFSIDSVSNNERFDTPVRGLPLKAGYWNVDFVVPTQKNRVIRKRILILPGHDLKIFEDFRNY